jgi:outer membrane lipoprotein SlyB
MTIHAPWRRAAAILAAAAAMLAAGGAPQPSVQVTQPASRDGTVESIQTQQVQQVPSALGAVGGALVGGGLGSLIGGGTGRTVATVVGAVGGGYVGHQMASGATHTVWIIGVRYDDGSFATVQQTAAPGLRIGDRVRVTPNGVTLLR